jgi:uncharacterized protein YqgC (DUF456 family)
VSTAAELVVALVILVGLIGVIVPLLPGVLLIFGAIAVWAFVEGTTTGWVVLAVATVLLLVSGIIKYTWPGKQMQVAGVPTRSIVIGALVGIVGFFVIPVVGLVIGFVLGTFLAELARLRNGAAAMRATLHAVKAVGLSLLIELGGALLAAGVWLIGAFVL